MESNSKINGHITFSQTNLLFCVAEAYFPFCSSIDNIQNVLVSIYWLMKSNIEEALRLLSKEWKIEPIIQDFILGKVKDVSDFPLIINDVIFHIPYIKNKNGYILWKCYWPDCHNCCNRQGRLPLTSK